MTGWEKILRRLIAGFTLLSSIALPISAQSLEKPPNIVVILVDDAAFMDFGGYGGEAETPNINRIADQGVRFLNYRTSPLCSPSRAMLLTGIDNHLTGVSTIPEVLIDSQRGQPGYEMAFVPDVRTIADKLSEGGYRTYMTGKWHLGSGDGDLPNSHGFDRSFVLDASGADNWEQKPYIPYYSEAPWFEDGEPATLPDDFYSSKFIIDQMISYIEGDGRKRAPFFAYMAFQAIHIPVQAPQEFIDKYEGVYDQGWEALQDRRWREAKALGLIPETAPAPAMPDMARAWTSLSADEKALFSKSMSVNAAMIDAMDHHIGRFINHLEQQGELENTLFVITSDNGPAPSDPVHQRGMGVWMSLNDYHYDLGTLGLPGSLAFIGPEWAAAASSPGSIYKFASSEGGLRVPMIVSGPGVEASGFLPSRAMVTDITPTLLDFARVESEIANSGIPMTGRSLKPVLTGNVEQVYGDKEPMIIEVSGNVAVYQGDYKLQRMTLPYGDGKWRLYNVVNDPGETTNIRRDAAQAYEDMLRAYERYADEVGVIAPPDDFNIFQQIKSNTLKKIRTHYSWPFAFIVLLLIVVIYFVWRLLRRPRYS